MTLDSFKINLKNFNEIVAEFHEQVNLKTDVKAIYKKSKNSIKIIGPKDSNYSSIKLVESKLTDIPKQNYKQVSYI